MVEAEIPVRDGEIVVEASSQERPEQEEPFIPAVGRRDREVEQRILRARFTLAEILLSEGDEEAGQLEVERLQASQPIETDVEGSHRILEHGFSGDVPLGIEARVPHEQGPAAPQVLTQVDVELEPRTIPLEARPRT